MTNAQFIARELALSILKAYHREIKSGFVSDASAIERERAQAAAFAEAEKHVRKTVNECCEYPNWLDEKASES